MLTGMVMRAAGIPERARRGTGLQGRMDLTGAPPRMDLTGAPPAVSGRRTSIGLYCEFRLKLPCLLLVFYRKKAAISID